MKHVIILDALRDYAHRYGDIVAKERENAKVEDLQKLNLATNIMQSDQLSSLNPEVPVFRVNSGFAIVGGGLKPVHSQNVSLQPIITEGGSYITDPLPFGCHVIFGSAGDGKTVFATEIAQLLKISVTTIFERTFRPEDLVALSYVEIEQAIRKCLESPVAIIDSLRFIDLYGVGFPALEKGVNKGVFAFVQWLNILAARQGCHLFVIVSTERTDEVVKNTYQNYLNSAANSCWLLRGFGRGICIRADKPRSDWVPFSFKNNAVWSQDDVVPLTSSQMKQGADFNLTYKIGD